ncbi:MAG: flagellar biosynthesis anti-sigma factor FlgM [Acidobacteria bacterium]|nr:flagellar biosynthesis anti-sigma factor FlgM [Acidobacteriota bacterium]
MAKINLDKLTNFEPIRPERHAEVKPGRNMTTGPVLSAESTKETDRVDVSSRASEFGSLVNQVKELPDTRIDKVAEAQEQVNAGTFAPSADEIADAILKDEQF